MFLFENCLQKFNNYDWVLPMLKLSTIHHESINETHTLAHKYTKEIHILMNLIIRLCYRPVDSR